jgi:hypothetical protein
MIGGGGPVADEALGFQRKSAMSWLAFILKVLPQERSFLLY